MSEKYFLTKLAQADRKEIFSYIANSNPEAAFKVDKKLVFAFELLSNFPEIGHKRSYLTKKPFKFYSVYNFMIVYNPNTCPVRIIRIICSYRSTKNLIS
ncbi:MAG TPA: transcriptional regulator [Alphaproteobacteria bacterium]|nr:transcriptional regulator [Alphaproteobacteria bacterium]